MTDIPSPGRIAAPCYQCPDRHPACHGSCDRYKGWKDERQNQHKTRASFLRRDNMLNDHVAQAKANFAAARHHKPKGAER